MGLAFRNNFLTSNLLYFSIKLLCFYEYSLAFYKKKSKLVSPFAVNLLRVWEALAFCWCRFLRWFIANVLSLQAETKLTDLWESNYFTSKQRHNMILEASFRNHIITASLPRSKCWRVFGSLKKCVVEWAEIQGTGNLCSILHL